MWKADSATASQRADRVECTAPQLFFAPAHIETRHKQLGPVVFSERVREAQEAFFGAADAWLEIVERHGPAAVEASYHAVREGRLAPQQGLVLTP